MARTITLKFDGTCRDCGAELLAGMTARYYGRGRLYGTDCHEDSREGAARSTPGAARSAAPLPIGRHAVKITAAEAALLGARRRKATLAVVEAGSEVECTGTYWDGGSRSAYALLDTATRRLSAVPCPTDPPQFGGGDAPRVSIEAGAVLVQCGTYCGKPGYPTVHGTAEDIAALGLGA